MRGTTTDLVAATLAILVGSLALSGCSSQDGSQDPDSTETAQVIRLDKAAAEAFRNTYATTRISQTTQLRATSLGDSAGDGIKVTGWQSQVCGAESTTPVTLPTLSSYTEGVAADEAHGIEAHASVMVFATNARANKAMAELLQHPRTCPATGPRVAEDQTGAWTPLGEKSGDEAGDGPGMYTTKGTYTAGHVDPAAPVYLEQLIYDKNVVIALDGVQHGRGNPGGNETKNIDPVLKPLRAKAVKVLKTSGIDMSVALNESLSGWFTG